MFEVPAEYPDRMADSQYWVIFVHGGAWRDPSIDANAFAPACRHLLNSPLNDHAAGRIRGYASLNYRLSKHPDWPQDLNNVSEYDIRDATHPDHVVDVITGIASLQERFGFGDKYVLIGHSCGATIALQTVMNLPEVTTKNIPFIPPTAILAVDGIFDIPELLESFKDIPEYSDSIVRAFGSDPKVWAEVSPARGEWMRRQGAWGRNSNELLMIAHSRTDELIDWKQVDQMAKQVRESWCNSTETYQPRLQLGKRAGNRREDSDFSSNFTIFELHSTHHEIWEQGWELARAITAILHGLKRLEDQKRPFPL